MRSTRRVLQAAGPASRAAAALAPAASARCAPPRGAAAAAVRLARQPQLVALGPRCSGPAAPLRLRAGLAPLHARCRGFASAPKVPHTTSPKQRYKDLIAIGEINQDANQEKVVDLLSDLAKRINGYAPGARPVATKAAPAAAPAATGGIFGLFGATPKTPAKPTQPPRIVPTGPKGLYIWGGCGSGKTFLMDLFFDTVPVDKKKRIHFHEWMIDVHERLHRLQKKNALVQEKANTVWTAEAALAQQKELKKTSQNKSESADDLVVQVANEMMSEAWLLCFDEFQVTHISDAIIMKRLFSVMFERGAIVVATSNRPPEDLYLNGLNRPLFLPFIPMLRDFCDVHDIASQTDYRLITEGEEEDRRVYIYPNGKEEKKLIERKFYRLCKGEILPGGQVETQGRRILVPKAAVNSNVAWFTFKDLCDKPLGAGDYLAIASAFHTVFIAEIPKLTLQERDQVRRFITLIDAFYERHTKLVCTADRDPISLFQVTEEERRTSVADEIFAWDRTVSRLMEMQSVKYLSEQARVLDSEQFLGQFDLRALTDEDLVEMWRRYDADDSGEMDPQELRYMLEDILEKQQGHRNLQDDVFTLCMDTIDLDKNGVISYPEFEAYLKNFTTVSKNVFYSG